MLVAGYFQPFFWNNNQYRSAVFVDINDCAPDDVELSLHSIRLCRPKKDSRGETNAKEISDVS